ncbi:MAG: group I intron-associated PD-(D/E)XK endonuclease [Halobacteriaceae archaeon]
MESHRKGDVTEARVIAEFKEREIPVSIPFGDNERYDVVVESDEEMYRIQIKTGWPSDGCIHFHGKSSHTNATGNVYKKYDGDVDYFAVYCAEVEELYLIGEDEFETNMQLRVEEPGVNQPTINWASEYEFGVRWPPRNDSETRSADRREEVIHLLRTKDVDLFDARSMDVPYDVLLRTPADTFVRAVIRYGSESEDRLRFDTGNQRTPGPEEIDAVLVYRVATEALYLVDRSTYDVSCSLGLSAPAGQSCEAAAYRFEERWPTAVR